MSGGHRYCSSSHHKSSSRRPQRASQHDEWDRRDRASMSDSAVSPDVRSSHVSRRTTLGGNRKRDQAEHRRNESRDTPRRASTIENRNVYTTAEPKKKAKQNRSWYKKAGRWLGKTVVKGLNLIGKVEGGRDVPVGRLVEDEYENPSSHGGKHSRRHRGRSGAR